MLHVPKIAGFLIATAVFIAAVLAHFVFLDQTPPFKYIAGDIYDCADWRRFETCTERKAPAPPLEEVVRSRLTSWFRSDCDLEVSGHLVDAAGSIREIDRFAVPIDPEWVAETRANKPHRFTRPMRIPATMFSRLPDGSFKEVPIAPGVACYSSLDHAVCNPVRRNWPKSWSWRPRPIEIIGFMMCFEVASGR